jgi:outer membrane receptor protein involved in Fe transport
VYTTNQSTLGLPFAVSISGFTTLANNQYKIGVGNSYSYIDNLTLVHGDHTLKFGVEVRRIQLNQGNTSSGTISFSSTATFRANSVSSASYAAQLPVNGLRKTEVYSYAEDEWKLRPNLTLNLGVRYSFYNLFHEVLDRAIPFDLGTCGPKGFCGAGASFGKPNTLDIDPRLSVTWAPAIFGVRQSSAAALASTTAMDNSTIRTFPLTMRSAVILSAARRPPTSPIPSHLSSTVPGSSHPATWTAIARICTSANGDFRRNRPFPTTL